MSLLATELEELYQKVISEIPVSQIKKPEYKKKMDAICQNISYYVAVVHLPSIMPVYFCEKSLAYIGMQDLKFTTLTMGFYRKVLHPDNGSLFQFGVAHFFNHPNELFPFTCRVNVPSRGWRWVYGCSKLLTKEETGGARHTISILCDVEEAFEKQITKAKGEIVKILDGEQQRLFLLLTNREKEILKLIAEEVSSEDIAAKLYISEHTVRAHRKSILKKLKVKTSVGLVKFALYNKNLG